MAVKTYRTRVMVVEAEDGLFTLPDGRRVALPKQAFDDIFVEFPKGAPTGTEVDGASATQALRDVREVIRELVVGNPVVAPEKLAEWLAIFLATSRSFDAERADELRRLTVELAEERRYVPDVARGKLEVTRITDGVGRVEIIDSPSEHDDG